MANEYRKITTVAELIQDAEVKMTAGVDIAFTYSAKESVRLFKTKKLDYYTALYKYIKTDKNDMGKISFTVEDYNAVHNPFIPTQMGFLYNSLEQLYAYEVVTKKEVRTRTEELFEFIQGFEEITKNVFVKIVGVYVYLVNCNTGVVYARKFNRLQGKWGYIAIETGSANLVIGEQITKLYDNGVIWGLGLWVIKSTPRQKGYRSFEIGGGICFRVHTVIIALVYGLEVAKFLVGRNSFLTIEHIDKQTDNNSISNLCIYTRASNRLMAKDENHMAYDFIELFDAVLRENRHYYLI